MNRVGALLAEVRGDCALTVTERGMAEWWANRQREMAAESGRERSLAAADCPECNRRIWLADGRLIPHPPDDDPQSSLCPGSLRTPDAQRRSEAIPQNDLLGPSRVDPYDTTKGGVTDGP